MPSQREKQKTQRNEVCVVSGAEEEPKKGGLSQKRRNLTIGILVKLSSEEEVLRWPCKEVQKRKVFSGAGSFTWWITSAATR